MGWPLVSRSGASPVFAQQRSDPDVYRTPSPAVSGCVSTVVAVVGVLLGCRRGWLVPGAGAVRGVSRQRSRRQWCPVVAARAARGLCRRCQRLPGGAATFPLWFEPGVTNICKAKGIGIVETMFLAHFLNISIDE